MRIRVKQLVATASILLSTSVYAELCNRQQIGSFDLFLQSLANRSEKTLSDTIQDFRTSDDSVALKCAMVFDMCKGNGKNEVYLVQLKKADGEVTGLYLTKPDCNTYYPSYEGTKF